MKQDLLLSPSFLSQHIALYGLVSDNTVNIVGSIPVNSKLDDEG